MKRVQPDQPTPPRFQHMERTPPAPARPKSSRLQRKLGTVPTFYSRIDKASGHPYYINTESKARPLARRRMPLLLAARAAHLVVWSLGTGWVWRAGGDMAAPGGCEAGREAEEEDAEQEPGEADADEEPGDEGPDEGLTISRRWGPW